MDFDTRAIHVGQAPDPDTGAVIVPIYQTSTYAQKAVGEFRYDYARTANPTRDALQECLASLEGARHGLAFASGMAAIDDDHASARSRTAGGVGERRLRRHVPAVLEGVRAQGLPVHLRHSRAVQHRACRAPGRRHRARLARVADQPAAQRRSTCGRRPTQHTRPARSSWSTTRSPRRTCNGRSSTAPTSSCTRRRSTSAATPTSWAGSPRRTTTAWPSVSASSRTRWARVPGPFDAWLVLRGLKTLGVRMRAHCENAARVVDFLQADEAVERVLYPGLPSHPGPRDRPPADGRLRRHDLVPRALRGEAVALVARTKIWTLAESLGGVESLIEHPGRMTHASTADSAVRDAAQPGAALGRHRVGRRPDRRPRPGAARLDPSLGTVPGSWGLSPLSRWEAEARMGPGPGSWGAWPRLRVGAQPRVDVRVAAAAVGREVEVGAQMALAAQAGPFEHPLRRQVVRLDQRLDPLHPGV